MELSAKEAGITYSLIGGIQKIKLAGAEKRAFAKWATAYCDNARLRYAPPSFLKFSSVISTCISLIGSIVIIILPLKLMFLSQIIMLLIQPTEW